MNQPIQSTATITLLKLISPNIMKVELSTESALSHLAGQWVDMSVLIDGELKVGGYTLCSAAGTSNRIELAIRQSSHPVSTWIHKQASVGDTVTIRGGCGRCYYQPKAEDELLFVVGGIGITPVISMLRSIHQISENISSSLFYSVKKPQDVLYQEELEAYTSCHFRYTDSEDRWRPSILSNHITEKTIIYIFGPPSMIKEWTNYLSAQKLQDRLHFEKWW